MTRSHMVVFSLMMFKSYQKFTHLVKRMHLLSTLAKTFVKEIKEPAELHADESKVGAL